MKEEDTRPKKHVEDSMVEQMHLLQYKDINGENRLFGGRLLEWIDEAAGLASMRHCGGNITTASIDSLQFRKAAYLNDIVIVKAKVTYVGNTSMEIRVDVYVEDKATGLRHMINHAYLTEVHVDEKGHPLPVPYGLALENDMERLEWEGAKKRKEIRRNRRIEGY